MDAGGEGITGLVLGDASELLGRYARAKRVGAGRRSQGGKGYTGRARSPTRRAHGKNEHSSMRRPHRDFEDSDFGIEWLRPVEEPGRSAGKVWAVIGLLAAPAVAAGLLHLLR